MQYVPTNPPTMSMAGVAVKLLNYNEKNIKHMLPMMERISKAIRKDPKKTIMAVNIDGRVMGRITKLDYEEFTQEFRVDVFFDGAVVNHAVKAKSLDFGLWINKKECLSKTSFDPTNVCTVVCKMTF